MNAQNFRRVPEPEAPETLEEPENRGQTSTRPHHRGQSSGSALLPLLEIVLPKPASPEPAAGLGGPTDTAAEQGTTETGATEDTTTQRDNLASQDSMLQGLRRS